MKKLKKKYYNSINKKLDCNINYIEKNIDKLRYIIKKITNKLIILEKDIVKICKNYLLRKT